MKRKSFPTRVDHLPPYILGEVTALMMQERRAGKDIINLGMGNPDLTTPAHIVDKLIESAAKPKNHRYSVSRGIPKLRMAIAKWYQRNYEVEIDPETEAIATIGAKEGLSHLMLALTEPGDVVLVPDPCYPIHAYSVVIAGATVRPVPIIPFENFWDELKRAATTKPKPKLMILSFPSNPTTQVVDLEFFKRVVTFAKEHEIRVVHDLAYADLVFDGYEAPSILQVKGAGQVAVEFYSLSKGYSMPGWRVGFCCGNQEMIYALTRIKSYLDYGMFNPIQIAATVALDGPQKCVKETVQIYRRRRDVLCEGLDRIGWPIEKPQATMFVWAKIPSGVKPQKSLAFSKQLLLEGQVAVSGGIGFGACGEGSVRFALVENEHRIRQAVRGIKKVIGA